MGVTAIVTGVGGPAGVSVVRALQALGHRVVGIDADATAVGLALADHGAVVPRVDEPGFIDALCDLGLRTGSSALISTVAEEMVTLSAGSDALSGVGLAHWVPTPEAVRACTDKWRFALACRAAGVPVPATALGRPDGVPGPWIVKPRFGRGSRHTYEVDADDDPSWVLRRVPEPVWQTRLTGREFSVDALVDRDGVLVGAVPRWRLEARAGVSTKGTTFADADLVAAVGDVLAAVGLRGPANVQGFREDAGTQVFVEVNPRFSGGLPLALAAGSDLVGEYLQAVLGQPIDAARLGFRPGVTMARWYEEVFGE